MKLVKRTEHLNVFDAGVFQLFEGEPCRRHLYVGFVRHAEDDPKRWPVVTALFTAWRRFKDGSTSRDFLEWLETSRYTGEVEPLEGQIIRDEFMATLEELHPGASADPEMWEAKDGSVQYLDTLDGEEQSLLEVDEE